MVIFYLVFLLSAMCVHFTKNDLYTSLNGHYCIRRLTENGRFGCASSYKGIKGKVIRINQDNLSVQRKEEFVALMDFNFFANLNEKQLQNVKKMTGILIEHNKEKKNISESLERPNPFENVRPKQVTANDWNPHGKSNMYIDLKIPVYLLSDGNAKYLNNELQKHPDRIYAKMRSEMLAKHNSKECIAQEQCDPIGGYSIWSTYTHTNLKTTKYLILTARLSSNSMFGKPEMGAGTSLSGLATLLTIAKTLKEQLKHEKKFYRKSVSVLYAVFDKEEYNLMGSKTFAENLKGKHCEENAFFCSENFVFNFKSFYAINKDNIIGLIDFGDLANFDFKGEFTENLFGHTNKRGENSIITDFLKNLEANSKRTKVKFETISSKKIPPSPLWSFLGTKNFENLEGVVLNDFRDQFINGRYQSDFDEEYNKEHLLRIAKLLYVTLAQTVWDIEVDDDSVKLRTMETIINCLTKQNCEEAFKGGPARKILNGSWGPRFNMKKATGVQATVRNILQAATSARLPLRHSHMDYCKQNEKGGKEHCQIQSFVSGVDNFWCRNQDYHLACYFSATYFFPSISTGFDYWIERNKWIIRGNDTYSIGMQTISKTEGESAKIYVYEHPKEVYLMLSIGGTLILVTALAYCGEKKVNEQQRQKMR